MLAATSGNRWQPFRFCGFGTESVCGRLALVARGVLHRCFISVTPALRRSHIDEEAVGFVVPQLVAWRGR
jgi:hypothetical protein